MRTIQTSAIIGKIKVFYEYQEDEKSNTLNQLLQQQWPPLPTKPFI